MLKYFGNCHRSPTFFMKEKNKKKRKSKLPSLTFNFFPSQGKVKKTQTQILCN